ncbi:probable amino acid permease 7 isoform X2 [Amaranthus tricolor]|uniref:probable amino acid permease 7 isoform X2 n=1 Tax=Amaranthus tricolor TaxID=29722 RepID=UPI002582F88A|nr:probable amino acid permease 7 isoform X2 [Amaranthus tricolor]
MAVLENTGEDAEQQAALLGNQIHKSKTGTIRTGIAHIITGVIGAGVLSLGWNVAQLGWVAGPIALLLFAGVTLVATFLLCDCYRAPDPDIGPIVNSSYMNAVTHFLGRKQVWYCGLLQYLSMCGAAVAYIITTSISIRAIQKSNCYHKRGHQASCSYGDDMYMLLFGGAQIIVSQIPDFHNMEWLSILAAIMSFSYSTIGLGLGFAKVIGNRTIKGNISGVPNTSTLKKLSLSFQALGDIAFAYPYSLIVLEIQDTMKSPPPENRSMKKASLLAVLITTFFYLTCACFGYAAFGNDTPGNILTGFGFYEPYWLIDFANACVVVHLVGGYQVYSQPVFAFVEGWLAKEFPNSGFVNDFHSVKLSLLPTLRVNLLRLCFRTAYVVSTTGIAMVFPYFNQVLGVLGALGFWPLSIYFPVEMYIVQKKINVWTTKGILLRGFSVVCFLVSIVALVGSIEGLVSAKLE